ncbi:ATP-dependent zinc protease family protein [Nocardioides sp. GXQ0305]|uniref:ATP-dependent zinc protease family protein n=1 Tax=Nocardioides sp. GXQ0305 TaxID=3423912 RepID=UPI003D7C5469
MAEPGTGTDADSPSNTIAGWREWVSLPGLGVGWIKAKCDTGARTSAIHAFDLEAFERDGGPWVRYSVHPWQDSDDDAVACESAVVAQREVRSSSGHVEERYVVSLDLSMVGREVNAEVSLSRRDEMGFRMLIGREALRQGFLVDPGRSYLGGRPKRSVRRQNRGR